MPRFAAVFLLYLSWLLLGYLELAASLGNSFVILASFKVSSVYAIVSAFGMVLGACI